MSAPSNNPLLQTSPFAKDAGQWIGRDPRDVPSEDWSNSSFLVGLAAIRAKCLDCAFNTKEIRKCVQTDCPLWPLRMGCVPKGYRKAAITAKTMHDASAGTSLSEEVEAEQNPSDEAENDVERAQ
ncbi:hypothetical protein TRM7615_05017 [Falsiruegeria mediterranea M17]|uniref:Uncharacterized protein n=1 Tax=Falsiruegeria mediterranea M17 TaxID=1200281 RepID=A0A2R8CG97_9RHOB|nr:hypothetical protein TRM7615_05017 [Falsiruegeria mediterranea M17]